MAEVDSENLQAKLDMWWEEVKTHTRSCECGDCEVYKQLVQEQRERAQERRDRLRIERK